VCSSGGVGRRYIGVVCEVAWADMGVWKDLGSWQGFVTILATWDSVLVSAAVRNFMVVRRNLLRPSTYLRVPSVSLVFNVAIRFRIPFRLGRTFGLELVSPNTRTQAARLRQLGLVISRKSRTIAPKAFTAYACPDTGKERVQYLVIVDL